MFDLSEKPLSEIAKAINECDVIVFQTTWLSDVSKKLFDYISSLPTKKIIVEVYIFEPTWYYASQHGSKHDVYIYNDRFEIFWLLCDRPYWEEKNNI